MTYSADELFSKAPVIPVITIDEPESAVPLARALVAGGLPVLEITLRTPAGLPAIAEIKQQVPDAIVGAGTVLNIDDLENALAAGSEFLVSPGQTETLLKAGAESGVPYLPGVANVSDMMRCLDAGFSALKFFPAEAMGGVAALKAFGGPFPQVSFCPTGGVGPANLASYLAVPSVRTVGGTWVAPKALVQRGDWGEITRLASEACRLVSEFRQGEGE